jgi:tight adherence protein B
MRLWGKEILRPKEENIDYRHYLMSAKQWVTAFAISSSVIFAVGVVFYGDPWIATVLSLSGVFYPRMRRAVLMVRRRKQLTEQFKHALQALSSALGAGKSLESAFVEAIADLRLLYPDPRTFIVRELEAINFQVENRIPIEKAFERFSQRSGVEDIEQFGEILTTCKRSGGDLNFVIRRTSDLIGEKLDIEQEISVQIAQKRFESKVLSAIPIAVIGLLKFSSADYMQPLYHNMGRVIMTVSLLLLTISFVWTKRIMRMSL